MAPGSRRRALHPRRADTMKDTRADTYSKVRARFFGRVLVCLTHDLERAALYKTVRLFVAKTRGESRG